MMSSRHAEKALLIGMDCAVPARWRRYAEAGLLPVGQRLLAEGYFVPECLPAMPTLTTTNWATIATGAWPGTHGVTDFNPYRPGDAPRSSPQDFDGGLQGFDARDVRAEFVWEAAVRAGLDSVVVNWPGAWPPRKASRDGDVPARLEKIDAQLELLDAGIIEAEPCLALGDSDGADGLPQRSSGQAQAMGADLGEARALCALGSVQLARGDPVGATERHEVCVALAEASGLDYERAKALVVLTEAQRRCGADDVECAATLGEAIDLFEQMGARYELEKALEVRDRLEPPAAGAGRRGPGPSSARSRSAAP